MQNYNNNANYRDMNHFQNSAPRGAMPPVNNGNNGNVWNTGGTYNGVNYPVGNYPINNYQTGGFNQTQVQQPQTDDRIFVAGRLGADAFQLQPGVMAQVLWDDDVDRFYIKGYDEKGRQRVVGDFDFFPHVEPDSSQTNTDMSKYATKDDIRNMISDAFKKNKNNSNYITMETLNKILSELCVGNGGKVVRINESDA